MRRRSFVTAAIAAGLVPSLARAQTVAPTATPIAQGEIEPATPLERAFVMAFTDQRMRPIFRQYFLDTSVALALAGPGNDAAPLEVEVREGWHAGAIYTSAARLDAVLGADAPRIVLNGRAALERLRGKNAVLNYRLVPMLTLDHEDVATYLSREGSSSAGPTQ
jgi:hypothetical protein